MRRWSYCVIIVDNFLTYNILINKQMEKRRSGILLHITSLPSSYGIGDLGPGAYGFVDFLSQAQQAYWQLLPLNPTITVCGNSPYSSVSAFAGNSLLISPDLLIEDGLLIESDLRDIPCFEQNRCDYDSVISFKLGLFEKAFANFKASARLRKKYERFCKENSGWLEDYALFIVIKNSLGGKMWSQWPKDLIDRNKNALNAVKKQHKQDIEKEKFLQFIFYSQWFKLKDYCRKKSVFLIGDIPIYVNFDSADVWANPEIFKLNKQKQPVFVAGVPPDYFSNTGQLWGNPVYNWDVLKKTGFKWWIKRLSHTLRLFDIVRIDHFRGLVAFWQVASTEKTAIKGRWIKAPCVDFFKAALKHFSSSAIIAEDLGIITPDVRKVMKQFGFPGMRVLLFAFGEDNPKHLYLPHNYVENCLVYTGTHDNNTIKGWFEREASPDDKKRLFSYIGREVWPPELNWELIRLAMASIADVAIFPLQDVLCLGQEAKMNRPGTLDGNWQWRVTPEQLNPSISNRLAEMTTIYARASSKPR